MEYLRGYRVIRQDPDWTQKFLWGSLAAASAMFIPLLGQIVLVGWQARIMQGAARGVHTPLPELKMDGDLLGKLLGLGFKGFIVRFLWQIPYMIVIGGSVMAVYIASFMAAMQGDGEMIPIIFAVFGASMIVLGPIGLLLLLPSQAAALRAELTGELSEGLKFSEVLGFTKRNFWTLIKGTFILGIVGSMVIFAGMILCYVGIFPAAVAIMVAQAHFIVQVYEQDLQKGGPKLRIENELSGATGQLGAGY